MPIQQGGYFRPFATYASDNTSTSVRSDHGDAVAIGRKVGAADALRRGRFGIGVAHIDQGLDACRCRPEAEHPTSKIPFSQSPCSRDRSSRFGLDEKYYVTDWAPDGSSLYVQSSQRSEGSWPGSHDFPGRRGPPVFILRFPRHPLRSSIVSLARFSSPSSSSPKIQVVAAWRVQWNVVRTTYPQYMGFYLLTRAQFRRYSSCNPCLLYACRGGLCPGSAHRHPSSNGPDGSFKPARSCRTAPQPAHERRVRQSAWRPHDER